MVLAGPGSGKTSVIVERTAYLISQGKVPPSSILVVTFSRSAVREMKERFYERCRSEGVTFGTFHGVFYGILKQSYRLGPGNVISEKERYDLLREILLSCDAELSGEGDFLEEISREISIVRGNRIKLEHYYSTCCPDEVFRQIYREYRRLMKEKRKLDFDDMLVYCYELFRKRPDILEGWRKKFRYILIDEFQDINQLQYEIIRLLAAPRNNLFIVGDDDQSIYHFRGARPEIMLHFPEDYPQTGKVVLDVNYRCSREVLKASQKLIACNKKRFRKKIRTENAPGLPVESRSFENPREECLFLAGELKKELEQGHSPEETAVLIRTNQEAETVVRAFMEYQLPFRMEEKIPNLYNHWIAQDILAYLKLGEGDRSRKNFLQVMNRPNRYIRRDVLTDARVDFSRLLAAYEGKDWMQDRLQTMEVQLRIMKNMTPFAAINFVRKGIGYEDYLREYAEYRKMKPEDLLEILDQVQESARGMRSLADFEEYIRLFTEKLEEEGKKQKEHGEGIRISTLHRAKGLEYDQVYILNVNEGTIPYKKATLPEMLEEERRLLYVGMTRARKKLVLCHIRQQYEKKREPSRFLREAGILPE